MRDAVLIPDFWAEAAAGGDVETVFLRPRPDFPCRDGSGLGWARWRGGGHLGAGEQRDLTNHRIGEADPLAGGKPLPVHAGHDGISCDTIMSMAMTLRLADDETEALRRRAEFEHRSMQEVARQAIREYVENHSRAELLDRVLEEELPRYAEALERLGQ